MTQSKAGLPAWSKALMTMVCLALTSTFVLGILAILQMKKLGSEWIDPVFISRVAGRIADLPQPLPNGYHYLIGVSLPTSSALTDVNVVTIQHEPDKQLLTLISCGAGDQNESLNRGYRMGLNMLTTNAAFTKQDERGSTKIGDLEMPYILGDTEDLFHRKAKGMVGCLQPPVKGGKKNILIYGLQTSNVPYNQQITIDLLNSIKSF